jgi:hypothetical protein
LIDLRDQRLVVLTVGYPSHFQLSLGNAETSCLLNKEDDKIHLLEHRVDDVLEGAQPMISLIKSLKFACSNSSFCRDPLVNEMTTVCPLQFRRSRAKQAKKCEGRD